jgi:hypothetical protein
MTLIIPLAQASITRIYPHAMRYLKARTLISENQFRRKKKSSSQ